MYKKKYLKYKTKYTTLKNQLGGLYINLVKENISDENSDVENLEIAYTYEDTHINSFGLLLVDQYTNMIGVNLRDTVQITINFPKFNKFRLNESIENGLEDLIKINDDNILIIMKLIAQFFSILEKLKISDTTPDTSKQNLTKIKETLTNINIYLEIRNKQLANNKKLPPLIIRQRSSVCSFQGIQETCYAHAVAKMVSRLLKMFFSTYFPYDKEMIDNYYNTILCNTNKIIFDCFIENDFIKDKSFKNEHISALLFHFIYSILTDKFGKCGGFSPTISCLFILDYFKYIDITVELIKSTLKYSSKYEMTINTYFEEDLIIKLYNIFINIKKSFTDKTFNPILYTNLLDEVKVVEIIYMQKEDDGKIIPFSSKVPNIPIPLYSEYPISKTELSIHKIFYDNNNKLQKILQTSDFYKSLKYILKNGFYALFLIHGHVITITDYNDSDNTLIVKNTWGNSKESKIAEHDWCGNLIRDNKVNIDDLKLLDKDKYKISFFYSEITVPSAPTIGKAIPGDSQCIVNWTASGSNGGSAITGYTVTSILDGKTATIGATESSVIVKGLSNDKSYTFTVVAKNNIGNSLPSSLSNSVTPKT